MQYQCDSSSAAARPPRPSRLSESSLNDEPHAGDARGDVNDQSGGVRSLPAATRSNSDAASLCGMWREARRRRSDTDTEISSRVRDGRYVSDSHGVTVNNSLYMCAKCALPGGRQHVPVDDGCHSLVTDQTTPTSRSAAPHAADSAATDARSPSRTYQQQQSYRSSAALGSGTVDRQQLPRPCVRCGDHVTKDWVDVRRVDMSVSFVYNPQYIC